MFRRSMGCMVFVLMAGALPGCSMFDSVHTSLSVRGAAKDAWAHYQPNYCGLPYEGEMKDGFKDGYKNYVYTGSTQGPCSLPCKYGRKSYQTCFGRRKLQAYYEGYQLGISAASVECAGGALPGGCGCNNQGGMHGHGPVAGPGGCKTCQLNAGPAPCASGKCGCTSFGPAPIHQPALPDGAPCEWPAQFPQQTPIEAPAPYMLPGSVPPSDVLPPLPTGPAPQPNPFQSEPPVQTPFYDSQTAPPPEEVHGLPLAPPAAPPVAAPPAAAPPVAAPPVTTAPVVPPIQAPVAAEPVFSAPVVEAPAAPLPAPPAPAAPTAVPTSATAAPIAPEQWRPRRQFQSPADPFAPQTAAPGAVRR